jgi:hypothetical protein
MVNVWIVNKQNQTISSFCSHILCWRCKLTMLVSSLLSVQFRVKLVWDIVSFYFHCMQSMFFTLTFTKTAQILFNQLLNDMSCKIVSYMLSILIRYSFWLTNWLPLERLYFVLFPVNHLSKIPQYVVVVRIITLIVVCIMHIHELLFPMKDLSGEKACVANFLLVVATYNRITVLMH